MEFPGREYYDDDARAGHYKNPGNQIVERRSKMRYVGTVIFIALVIGHFYVLKSEGKAAVKRVAYRWLMVGFGLIFIVFTALTVEALSLVVFVIPVVAFVVFMSLRFTKFCDWCGNGFRTNLPFVNRSLCPRCGSTIT